MSKGNIISELTTGFEIYLSIELLSNTAHRTLLGRLFILKRARFNGTMHKWSTSTTRVVAKISKFPSRPKELTYAGNPDVGTHTFTTYVLTQTG